MEKDLATRGGHEVKGVGPAAPKADLPRDLAVPIRSLPHSMPTRIIKSAPTKWPPPQNDSDRSIAMAMAS